MATPESGLNPEIGLNRVQPSLAHTSRFALIGGALLLVTYALCWIIVPKEGNLLRQLWFLPGVGVIGAIIANASGTGGGVVFVPVFNAMRDLGAMDLDPLGVTAVSMGIQAFGMSVGALRWTDRLYHQRVPARLEAQTQVRDYWLVCGLVLVLSVPALLATQRLFAFDGQAILLGYKTFSIVLGIALLIATWTFNRDVPERTRLEPVDIAVLALIAIPGGAITALFSVGIGELVAFYLFLRHYPILLSVGTACVISAVSVAAGLIWHIDVGTVQWEVVLLAAPGAMLGAFLARPIALWLGPRKLKTYGAIWIVGSALYLLWLNW
jgi:uncharacterized membrane protein YfcA